jgi:hypothetical protein
MKPDLILFIVAFILLILKAVHVETNKIDLGWLGLAFFVLAFII